ncbi:MAG TPA: TIGR02996 domain-containing protein [Gemmataceae bacterium]|nr:TIGR02996 domain-containing protein [Gemmataceae bacterium]
MPTPFTAEDRAFIRFILDHPEDWTAWLAYADWLDERDDPRAEYLRAQVELAQSPADDPRRAELELRIRELCGALPPTWVMILDRPNVENCSGPFKFRCPLKWEQLTPTPDEATRFCETCQREVLYCRTMDEARKFADEGFCVAISRAVARAPGDFDPEELDEDDDFEMGELDDGWDDEDD